MKLTIVLLVVLASGGASEAASCRIEYNTQCQPVGAMDVKVNGDIAFMGQQFECTDGLRYFWCKVSFKEHGVHRGSSVVFETIPMNFEHSDSFGYGCR